MSRVITCAVEAPNATELTCHLPGAIGAAPGFVAFLFAVFCAHWAMTTGRNAWLWFFAGLIIAPVAGLVLLYRTSQDRRRAP